MFTQTLDWVKTQGPYATNITCFEASGGILYCGAGVGIGSGLYKSTDNGNTWVFVLAGFINTIETNGTNLYIGGSSGVTISPDGGTTWVIRDTLLPLFSSVYSIKKVGTTLYACLGSDGFYKSTNEGKSWTEPSAVSGKTINTLFSMGSTLILGEAFGIMISTNNGSSWTEEGGDIPNHSFYAFAKSGTLLFAGTDAGVYRSSDGGATWNSFGSGIGNDVIISSILVMNDSSIFAGTAIGSPGAGIYRSNDTGKTWQLINSGLPNLSINSLFATGNQIFAGTTLSISSSSNNGESWQTSSSGLPKAAVTSVTSIYSTVFAGTSGSYIFITDDKGGHWDIREQGLTRPNVSTLFVSGSTLYAGTDSAQPKNQKGGLHISTNYGATWTQVTKGVPIMSVTSVAQSGTSIFVAGDSGVFSSADNGNSWTRFTNDLPTQLYGNDASLYEILRYGVYKYTESSGWTVVHTGTLDSSIHAIVEGGSYLFIGTDSGVYRSSDNGKDWSRVTGDSLHVRCFWEDDLLLAAGTTKGIYLSTDYGNTWQFQLAAGKASVNSLGYGHINLYAGTDSGVVQAPIDQYGVESSSQENSLILQVTNPSSDHAKIHYEIPDRNNISLTAFDLLGNVRAKILNCECEAGKYDLDWNVSALPSGTYMLCLSTKGIQKTAMVSVIH